MKPAEGWLQVRPSNAGITEYIMVANCRLIKAARDNFNYLSLKLSLQADRNSTSAAQLLNQTMCQW